MLMYERKILHVPAGSIQHIQNYWCVYLFQADATSLMRIYEHLYIREWMSSILRKISRNTSHMTSIQHKWPSFKCTCNRIKLPLFGVSKWPHRSIWILCLPRCLARRKAFVASRANIFFLHDSLAIETENSNFQGAGLESKSLALCRSYNWSLIVFFKAFTSGLNAAG